VFERADGVAMAKTMLAAHEHALVAVTCAIEVLEARERARGDRRLGQARGQFERVLHGATYDLVVDTGVLSPAECAARVATLLRRAAD
jgi:chloramphenicol 3-O phosphotransferase